MAKIIIRVILFVLVTLCFMVYLAPANKIVSLVKIPSDVKLYNVTGNIWDGRLVAVETKGIRIRNVNWHLTPLTLFFIGGARISIDDENIASATFGLDLINLSNRTSISELKFTTSLDKVYPFFKDAIPFPLNTSGIIKGDFTEIVLSAKGNLLSFDGRGEGFDISVDHPFEPGTKIILGYVELLFKGNGNELKCNISQNSEQFSFEGNLTIKNMEDLTVSGKLTPKGGMPDSLQSLLPMLGKADPDGKIRINYTTKLN